MQNIDYKINYLVQTTKTTVEFGRQQNTLLPFLTDLKLKLMKMCRNSHRRRQHCSKL